MKICGTEIKQNEKKKIALTIQENIQLPVWIIAGKKSGSTLVVTAGVHGCEYVGIETVQRFFETVLPDSISGNIIILPLVNPSGFYAGLKQIVPEDGKNLNRQFPGDWNGTLSQKIAYLIEKEIYPHADFLIDLHGGDWNEELIPLVFFPVDAPVQVKTVAREVAKRLPVGYRVQSKAKNGLYSYAVQCGIPALLLEIGTAGKWNEAEVTCCQTCLEQIMRYLHMIPEAECCSEMAAEQQESVEEFYEEAAHSGFWYPQIYAGKQVKTGQLLGSLKDSNGQLLKQYIAKTDGVVWYYTTSLGVSAGDALIAYGKCQ